MSEHLLTDVPFTSLELAPELLRGVEDAGFRFCTPIQAGALPKALAGQDVEGKAQTGTGKTAAFLLATMHRLLREPRKGNGRDGDPRALILAPTRELAVQIHKDALVLGKHTGLRMGVVFGGTGYESQREMLREGLDILIGTPGRLIDYYKQRIFGLDSIEVAVIDEADRMFDLGFIKDIRYLLRRMPPPARRLNMLFSATLSMRVSELAYEHMNSPTVVNANPDDVTVRNVTQVLYHVSMEEKIPLLIGLLRRIDATRTMVFVNTKRAAEDVAAYLEGNGLHAGLLTGDVPQRKRLALLEQFTRGELPVLVATDVASRGLHIPDVSHVVNYDLPQDAEDYVHRVGRTARAGASGDAVSFACERYVYSLMDIEEFIGHSIPTAKVTEDLLAEPAPPARRQRRPRSSRDGRPPRRGQRGRPRKARARS
ncbi:MAG: DEAD/DEAH box helicase [Gammaproteobacteria bacterium]|nr:DEAD/DEAH box helicase [Gammaproteobacteria bacterium]